MKNKRIDHINKIMSKHDDIFAENYIIFFSNSGKTGNVSDFEFNKF